ncbi:Gfo/Idh/MocA family protein [Jiangella alba]|uniref:Predicted dehydrogenase n=1 Tax=Jiangella alba TaxID=561176 RepID=A0A1H5PYA9_9ACTN|nr:Gfo/Idh/MocA family oxidoreductase [Jiangella alba]SEF17997.1 Predicted dehydrogenase [Jiangella alba]
MTAQRETGRGRYRVGVIGAGVRAGAYFTNIPAELTGTIELAAVADPDPARREAFGKLFGGESATPYETGAELLAPEALAASELDAVVIGTPNDQHAPDIVAAADAGLTVLAEKPVAISVAECAALWAATERAADRIVVGFVLRYVPFYARVREIVAGGSLGEILAIDADENLGTGLTRLFHRSWRASAARSGGFMVEKCCHDFDILNWLVGTPPVRVFSMAARSHFRPRPEAEKRERFITRDTGLELDFGERDWTDVFVPHEENNPYDLGADIPDHQQAIVEFAGGTLCTLTAAMAQPHTNRRLRIFGTDGALEGDLASGRIVVSSPNPADDGWRSHEELVTTNDSGHHGGDAVIGHAFWHTVAGVPDLSRAGVREGIAAVLVAAGAEESAATGRQVDLTAHHRQVFGPVV